MKERGDFYDELETRDPEARRVALFAALPRQVANAQRHAPAFACALDGVESAEVNTPEALAALPVTRKSDLIELQRKDPPFGGFAAMPVSSMARVFSSPGPIYEPEGRRADYWRMARAMYAAGFRRGDLVHNTFAYHFTPAGSMMESGAHAIGCAVFPAGVGQSELQARALADLRPRCYAGTPSFLTVILDKAAEMGVDASSLGCGLVSGEALPRSLREELGERGVDVLQCYATADLGLIAYESPARDGMVVDEGVIVEIVRPGTGEPVPHGEVGEVIVTTLSPEYPLIRFGTGDLSAVLPGTSACGRTNMRIKGWMGRADQTAKVRGMFVHPQQVGEVLKRHPVVGRGRLVIDNPESSDRMVLYCEFEGADDDLRFALVNSIREVCKLRGEVEFVPLKSLPNDGKVIDDRRSYD